MSEILAESALAGAAKIGPPEEIHNCPECSLWLAEGTLACPECHAIVYGRFLGGLAGEAARLEKEDKLADARAMWLQVLKWLPEGTDQWKAIAARVGAIDARTKAEEDTRAKWTKRLGPLAPVVLFLFKLKSLVFVLFKLKFLLSFFAFFGLYWALFGWRFGLGFTAAILIHELGHYAEVRRRGLKADLPVFLPGLGAYVRWYAMGIALPDLAAIALAGPFAGLLAALVCVGIFAKTGSPLFGALAHAGAWLNLVNLVPVLGLDGAQATHALDRLQRGLIVATCVLMFAGLHEGVFLFIAAGMTWRLFTGVVPEKPSTRTMVQFMLLLFALGALLWVVPDVGKI